MITVVNLVEDPNSWVTVELRWSSSFLFVGVALTFLRASRDRRARSESMSCRSV